MRQVSRCISSSSCALLLASAMAFGQAQPQLATVVVNGKSGQAPVIEESGRTYVDVEALARLANGSLSFTAKGLALTIPSSPASTSAAAETPTVKDDSALSRGFMKAGIEEIALLREWGAAVGYCIQNGYPVQEAWAASYEQKAAQGARLAEVAATTGGDKDALQLLRNEFDGVRDWSNQLVAASKSMNTAKYSMSPGSLREEPQAQKLMTCGHFLGSMLASGSFQDDTSCH